MLIWNMIYLEHFLYLAITLTPLRSPIFILFQTYKISLKKDRKVFHGLAQI